jgi:predicted DNA-binding protein (MmcQ/YjbR family)
MPAFAMTVDWIRRVCKALPHTTENVQWEIDLVFKVGGKMYAIAPLEPARVWLSFKCTPEDFAELTQRPSIIPAPYMARASWISLENADALPAAEVKRLLKQSYELVLARLPKKMRAELAS